MGDNTVLLPTQQKQQPFFNEGEMYVSKRNGNLEIIAFDKILTRIKKIGVEANIKINYTTLTMKVIDQLYNKISTTKIDELSAEQCASMASIHHDYNVLAGRIIVSNHQKNTMSNFSEVMIELYNYKDKHQKHSPLVSKELYDLVLINRKVYDDLCDYSRDYLIDYFGFKTLERSYLMKINKKTMERPQHLWLRVSIGIHGDNMERVIETYNLMSQKYFTHATPTLFNAGTPQPQLSSCFLQAMESDSIDGIFNTLKDCSLISKWSGGIGLHIHDVRATGSHIRGTNGTSNGLVPMLRVFNNTARYVDQCVFPDTIIFTTEGNKEIQQCIINKTCIFNTEGETEVIQNVLEHFYDGDIVEISTFNIIKPLKITKEHPVLVLNNENYSYNYEELKFKLDKKEIMMEWVEVDKLVENDYFMVHKIPSYSKDIQSITNDDCLMYGFLIAENNYTCNDKYITHYIENNFLRSFIVSYFEEKYADYKISQENNRMKISWTRNIHLPFRYNDFICDKGVQLISERWLNLPIEKSKFIIKGFIQNFNYNDVDSYIRLNNVLNKDIIFDYLFFLCLKINTIIFNYDTVIVIPKTKEICDLLNIEFKNEYDGSFRFFNYKDYLFTEIINIEKKYYKGVLYDLQMEKNHNYMLINGLVHNGGGKRNGSFAIYLEPWHADIELFLQLRKNHGDEEMKARDLFYALWIPDLFMNRVKSGGLWTLMCPDECPGLSDVYGEEFEKLYTYYEQQNKGRKTMNARDLWFQVLDSQMETGTPYLLYKDSANQKSNQKNLGTIKSSNLCTEIIEYSNPEETAVCNLASIALPSFVNKTNPPTFDYEKLHKIARVVTFNLNKVIDVNFYPTTKTKTSNMRHRPIGIGVQGLADVFMMMDIPFHSDEAKEINCKIFETIYHGSLEETCEISQIDGPYETFQGSPASQGILQFDMWNFKPSNDRYNWDEMKEKVKKGIRNSLLLAPMPTASTSQILGFNECIEPITSNIYSRKTIAGDFIIANKYLMNDLIKLDLWNEKIKNNIISNNGSIQQIDIIPEKLREKYKTVWEIPMKHLIDMSADRGVYICQSQSLNLWIEQPNYNLLTSMYFYGWQKGLKTGIYYLRRRGRHQAQQFTIEVDKKENNNHILEEETNGCETCSS